MTVGSGETYSNSLDARKRVSRITVQNPSATGNAMQPLDLDYGYTDRGNVASITGYFNRGNSQTVSLSNLQYDGLSRLHQATGFWGSSNAAANFSYDPWGNIDKRHVGGVNLGYQYDAVSNQLLSATFSGDVGLNYNRSFSYDGNGNVTSDGVKTYRYDHLNRLVRADTDGTTIQTNSYDGHGHRIRTIVNDGQRNRTTFFIYDPSGTLLHEYDQESGEQRDHIQFNGRSIATRSFHQDHDSDGDGLPDYFERTFGLPIFDASNADDDSDNDGLSDLVEYQLGLIPTSSDSDGDGISDGDEYPTYVTSSSSGTPGSAGRTLDPVFDYLNDL
jgi:YD repeat-containing protein